MVLKAKRLIEFSILIIILMGFISIYLYYPIAANEKAHRYHKENGK